MKNAHQSGRAIWLSLLWKEWHEHKWKLAALTAILLAVLFLFGMGGLDQYTLMAMINILFCYCFLVGIFLGMSTAGSESGRNTLPFLQSLPVPMWQPGATKLAVAILTAVLPLLAAVGVFCIWWTLHWFDGDLLSVESAISGFEVYSWGFSNGLVAAIVNYVLGVSSLLLWMAAMGLNRSDEIRSGAIGFLIICFVWLIFAFGLDQAGKRELPTLEYGIKVLLAAAPGGVASVGTDVRHEENLSWPSYFLPFLGSTIIGHGCVLTWYLRRFGKVSPGSTATDGKTLALAANKYQHLAPPMRSQLTAIAWKQVRETGPLALMAVGGIFLMSTLAYMFNDSLRSAEKYGEALGGITLSVGFFVTLVTGIGVFLEDLKPRVDDFWRSRPVNYQLWFGVKFVVGAAVLVATFGSLILLAYFLTDGSLLRGEANPILTVGFSGLVFLLIYTVSMSSYCIVRQPLYAAVLTTGIIFCGFFSLDWAHNYFFGSSMHWSVGLALLLFAQAVATTLAWQAVRKNWHISNQ